MMTQRRPCCCSRLFFNSLLVALVVPCGCRCSGAHRVDVPGIGQSGAIGGDRPALVIQPSRASEQLLPLVIALHGYGDAGAPFISYLGYRELAANEGFILVVPDGTLDRQGSRYWNATAACCNFFGGSVDDVAYLKRLISDARARFRIDPSRIYLIGLSNGGFMSYRMACEDTQEIAAVISIAGAAELDRQRCAPTSKVSVLQVHGDADSIVSYNGGTNILGLGGAAYPSARGSIERWAGYGGCTGRLVSDGAAMDLDRRIPGAETEVMKVAGCPAGIDVRLWTLHGGPHVPDFSENFLARSWAWLRAHPKASPPNP